MRNKAIRKHAKNYEFDIDFINKILDCFYVDDFTGGDSDFSKALGLLKKLKLRFLNRHFHLRKWRTKDPELRRIYLENTSNSLQPEKIPGILRFIFLKFVKLTKLDITKIIVSLQDMKEISVARNVVLQTDYQQEIELHSFSNARLQSYGECVYIRTVS